MFPFLFTAPDHVLQILFWMIFAALALIPFFFLIDMAKYIWMLVTEPPHPAITDDPLITSDDLEAAACAEARWARLEGERNV